MAILVRSRTHRVAGMVATRCEAVVRPGAAYGNAPKSYAEVMANVAQDENVETAATAG